MSPEPPAPRGPLHVETPLVHVPFLSKGKHNVFLKLETQQLSGSFKMRGIGHACLMARQKLGPDVHIVVASGAYRLLSPLTSPFAPGADRRFALRTMPKAEMPVSPLQRRLSCLESATQVST